MFDNQLATSEDHIASHANSTCNCDKFDKCKMSRDFQLVRFWLFILYFLN